MDQLRYRVWSNRFPVRKPSAASLRLRATWLIQSPCARLVSPAISTRRVDLGNCKYQQVCKLTAPSAYARGEADATTLQDFSSEETGRK
jgi:hypothetical protein